MATIKKAQKGAGVPKGYVRGEMSGKLIKESVQKKRTAAMAKDLDKGLAAKKKAAPKAKKGIAIKKANDGIQQPKVSLRSGQLKRLGRLSAKNPDRAQRVASRMIERDTRKQRGKQYVQSNLSNLLPKSKSGSSVKKCKYGCK